MHIHILFGSDVVITPRETANDPVHLVVTPDALRGLLYSLCMSTWHIL